MSFSSKSPRDYSQKYQRVILKPWRQSHDLSPSPPYPPPNRTPSTSPISINSLLSPSPLQNSTQNQIAHKLHHLSKLLEINLQQEIEATNPSPPTLPCERKPKKDKIGSKPDKNGKRGEAEKIQKQLQSIRQVKLKKTQKEGPEMQSHTSFMKERRKEGLEVQFAERTKKGIKSANI
nr:hypothetical protein [Tanacetum cinerariifolium]